MEWSRTYRLAMLAIIALPFQSHFVFGAASTGPGATTAAAPDARAPPSSLPRVDRAWRSGPAPDFWLHSAGDQLAHLPIEDIARIAAPDEAQRATLEALRAVATQTSDRLGADCPQSVPAAPEVRLEAVEQAIDAASAAFTAIEPALQQFYAALDDEQKARLLRDLTLAPQPRVSDRTADPS